VLLLIVLFQEHTYCHLCRTTTEVKFEEQNAKLAVAQILCSDRFYIALMELLFSFCRSDDHCTGDEFYSRVPSSYHGLRKPGVFVSNYCNAYLPG
jgi:hypothetical protein